MKTNLFPTREDLDNGWNFNCDSLESIKVSLPEQDGHYDIHCPSLEVINDVLFVANKLGLIDIKE